MKQVTLNIPENLYSFFMDLVKNMGIEKIQEKEIPTNESGQEVPAWQKEEVLKRIASMKKDEYVSWEDLVKEIK